MTIARIGISISILNLITTFAAKAPPISPPLGFSAEKITIGSVISNQDDKGHDDEIGEDTRRN